MFKTYLSILFAASLAGSLASCQQGGNTGGKALADSTQHAVLPIVYVNSDTLLARYEYFKDLQKELESQTKKLEDQVRNRTSSFQKQVSQYQQNAATMTASERQSTEQNLGKAQQDLQSLQQKASEDLMKAEQDANDKLYNKVQAYLKDYAAKNDYKLVLTYSRTNNAVLFADSLLDVTEEVVQGLNEAYAKEKQ